MRKYLAEFVGTLILVFVAAQSGHPLGVGLGLGIALWLTGHVSGGHYNPAVTLAMIFNKRMPAKDVLPYFTAQVLGALAGAGLIALVGGSAAVVAPAPTVADGSAVVAELILTSLFVGVIAISTLVNPKLAMILIPLTLAGVTWAGGATTGSVVNPAAGFGLSAVGGDLSKYWIYLVGPALGGVVAALLQRTFVASVAVADA